MNIGQIIVSYLLPFLKGKSYTFSPVIDVEGTKITIPITLGPIA